MRYRALWKLGQFNLQKLKSGFSRGYGFFKRQIGQTAIPQANGGHPSGALPIKVK